MEESTLFYAKKNIDMIAEENGIKTCMSANGRLCIELVSGRTFELSDKEIRYQAMEYVNNEIFYPIKND